MPVETQTLPGTITRGEGGDEIARGWCLVVWDFVGAALPLDEWYGEIAVSSDDYAAAPGWGDDLYIHFRPYGGVYEPWHGPITVAQVPTDDDPYQRRLKLTANGPLIRSRYTPEELAHGWPKEEPESTARP